MVMLANARIVEVSDFAGARLEGLQKLTNLPLRETNLPVQFEPLALGPKGRGRGRHFGTSFGRHLCPFLAHDRRVMEVAC